MIKVFITVFMFWVVLIASILMLTGCGEEDIIYGDLPYIDMPQSTITISEQVAMCKELPESVFCCDTEDIGYEQPSKAYAVNVLQEMNSNFTYVADDTWHYNQTVSEHLRGDCEDIASTMAMHMINDGIGKEWLYLVYRKISEYTAHMFLAVNTYDVGLIHLDYGNSGYPIEPQINYHLPLDDVSVWIKGNI